MIRCGTDIIEISRVKKVIETNEDRFLNRMYTDSEILYSESKKSQKYQHYAARFAAKEAVYKVISDKIDLEKFLWKDIEVVNEKSGKPSVKLHINVEGLKEIDISLSHCKEYAVASVVANFE